VRHVAWLNAAQKDSKDKPLPSRLEAIKEAGDKPDYPARPLCDYLTAYLFDAGPTMAGGMGAAPLSYSELLAWQQMAQVSLTAWEAQTLRRLSAEYLAQVHDAASPDCPPPWVEKITEVSREEVSKKVQNAFQTLMSTRPKK